MNGWTTHTGLQVILASDNIDTDQLIPARFMSTPRSEGYGKYLLHDLARDESGELLPDFPLSVTPGASVLIAGRNFGCGSSREAAVYALVDAGFRAVVAPSFGDIFAANAVNNGLLPARVSEENAVALMRTDNQNQAVTIDLRASKLTSGGVAIGFTLDPVWRQKLINGWDDIDLTQAESARIADYRNVRKTNKGWSWPSLG